MPEIPDEEKEKGCELKDWAVIIMSFLSQGFAYFICAVIIFHPPDMKDATVATLIGTLIGFAISEAKNWSSYWTGTTRSSSDQQKTISTMAATASAAGGTGGGTTTTAELRPDGTASMKSEPAKPGEVSADLEQKIKDLVEKYVNEGMARDAAEKRARQELENKGNSTP